MHQIYMAIGVVNLEMFYHFYPLVELDIVFYVPICTNKMVLLSVSIDTVETGLALLVHTSIPLHFWDFAFGTATYLINRLPGHW